MELRHITLFCLIKEQQSISKAARRALLSQPTVSQHLKTLERELGVALFDRIGRRVVPTQAGEIFYGFAKQIVRSLDEAHKALDEYLDLVRGELWIAGSTIPAHYLLPALLGKFCETYPGVRPHLQIGDSQEVIDKVRSFTVELGFVGARLDCPGLSFRPFAEDEIVMVVAAEHPLAGQASVSVDRLPELPFLAREPGSGTQRSWENALTQAGVDIDALNIVAEFGSTEAMVRAARAGLGVGIVSMHAVAEDLQLGRLVRLSLAGHRFHRTFYQVHHSGRALSAPARIFSSFVDESKLPGPAQA
jgi:DNA-binding transcriptional LysR family regulator